MTMADMSAVTSVAGGFEQLMFTWIDYMLFAGLLSISLLIGIYFGFCSKQDSAEEYLFGGKTMGYFPVAISTLSSMLSGITLLGIPTEVYLHGGEFALSVFAQAAEAIITIYIFIPVYYEHQFSNTYEYLELRFSRQMRIFVSIMYILSLMMYIPMVVYVPALAFAQVSGYNLHILTPVLSFICIFYTTIGGLKAVIWTDNVQSVFTLGGLITLLVLGLVSVGGFSEMWKIADAGGRLDIFNFDPSPFVRSSFWGLTVGLSFTWLSALATGQKFVQRFMAIEKEVDIKKAIICITVGAMVLNCTCVFIGILMYSKYHDCDLISAKVVQQSDHLFPYYVVDITRNIAGMAGIILAGIVSSALSTMSAALNTLSGIIYEDFIEPWIPFSKKNDAKAAKIMKWISVTVGLISIGLIFVIEHLGTIFELSISLRSVVEGPILAVFILGLVFPVVGNKGAVTGGIVSSLFMMWIIIGAKWHVINHGIQDKNLPMSTEGCKTLNETFSTTTSLPTTDEDKPFILYQLSMMYLVLWGTVIAIVVALITSYFTGEWNKSSKVNSNLLTPIVRRFLRRDDYEGVEMKEMPIKA